MSCQIILYQSHYIKHNTILDIILKHAISDHVILPFHKNQTFCQMTFCQYHQNQNSLYQSLNETIPAKRLTNTN